MHGTQPKEPKLKSRKQTVFPKVPDQHKVGKPLIPNGLGVIYVLTTTIYLFSIYFIARINPTELGFLDHYIGTVSASLTLAVCVLFGGFMGLLDDFMDLKWRYKAFMPLIAALPLMYYAFEGINQYPQAIRSSITLPFIGELEFGAYYVFLLIPIIVMIVTNVVNMLGGLNGLETLCPAIVIAGLIAVSPVSLLMVGPLLFWLALTYFNLRGKIFVGNAGSFAIGISVASFAILSDLKVDLAISILPFIFNSSLILLSVFFTRRKAKVTFDGEKLCSDSRKSLVTTIAYKRPLTERKIVLIIAAIVAATTLLGLILTLL
jgi:UDP-N-acetylglucosamine--dolichyl-phosphate N-acetylglucosaminephosphotransferase